jgi:nucleoside-diphosphate-sugar epimerase
MNSINLIIGCGYLGRRLLPLLHDQHCWFTHRSENSSNGFEQANTHQLVIDINNETSWRNINALSEKQSVIIYFMVPPSKIDHTVFPDFIKRLNQLDIKRSIIISSTVVYGNDDRIVDADSEVKIDSERAERQYQIEQDWLESMETGTVIRLAGIYGPDRVIGRSGIINNEIINGDPEAWLNLIHVDDAARLVKRISEMDNPEPIELACDGNPIKRREYYSFLAEQLNQTPPIFSHDSTERGMGRRCDNSVTISRSGWQPLHVDFRKTVSDLIKQNED